MSIDLTRPATLADGHAMGDLLDAEDALIEELRGTQPYLLPEPVLRRLHRVIQIRARLRREGVMR